MKSTSIRVLSVLGAALMALPLLSATETNSPVVPEIPIGSTPSAVTRVLGSPTGRIWAGDRMVWVYRTGTVSFRDDSVVEVSLVSEVERERREARRLELEEGLRHKALEVEKIRQASMDADMPWSETVGGLRMRLRPLEHEPVNDGWRAKFDVNERAKESDSYALQLELQVQNTTTGTVCMVEPGSTIYRLEYRKPDWFSEFHGPGTWGDSHNMVDTSSVTNLLPGQVLTWTFDESFRRNGAYHDMRFRLRPVPGLTGAWNEKLITPWIRVMSPPPSERVDDSSSWYTMLRMEFREGLGAVVVSNLWGFINTNGVMVVPPRYKWVSGFRHGMAMVSDFPNGENRRFIDRGGNNIWTNWAGWYMEGPAFKVVNGLVGYAGTNGEMVIKPTWPVDVRGPEFGGRVAWLFNDGMAAIWVHGKAGFIDKSGAVVIDPQFEEAHWFSDGLARVQLSGKSGFIDRKGRLVVGADYVFARHFSDGMAAVNVGGEYDPDWEPDVAGGKWGFVDKNGKLAIPARFDSVEEFRDGFADVVIGGRPRVIDKTGNYVGDDSFERVSILGDGMVSVWQGGKSGVIDREGKVVIPTVFDHVQSFSEGMAGVKDGALWAFVDVTGRVVIPYYRFDVVGRFRSGVCPVRIEAKWGLIDRTGKIVVSCKFDDISWFGDSGFWGVKEGDSWGYIDSTGKYIWKPTH